MPCKVNTSTHQHMSTRSHVTVRLLKPPAVLIQDPSVLTCLRCLTWWCEILDNTPFGRLISWLNYRVFVSLCLDLRTCSQDFRYRLCNAAFRPQIGSREALLMIPLGALLDKFYMHSPVFISGNIYWINSAKYWNWAYFECIHFK